MFDRFAVKGIIELGIMNFSAGSWCLNRLFGCLSSKRSTDSRTKLHTVKLICTSLVALCSHCGVASAGDLSQTIELVKSSVVAVGTLLHTRAPPANFLGTGFVVGDGHHIITNAHVVPQELNMEKKESLVIFVGRGASAKARSVTVVQIDVEHDVALLRMDGDPLPALVIGDSDAVKEGEAVAFTGFPIGMVLGLYPVTHQAIVSAITPIVIPALSTKQLDIKVIKRLRTPYLVFQLDGTAYPGNSGSPVYDPKTGKVVGVINMVFVKGTKENALTHPSGITYAIPGNYIQAIMKQ